MNLDSEDTMAVKSIGRYQIFDELGRGAMGVVYRGYDPLIGRTVALKTMIFGSAGAESRELRERLYREAAAAGALSHPNIVTIFDVVESGGTTAVAMEFIEGTDLASVIAQRGPVPLGIALDLFEQICAALDYAGGHGVVHRDIKPANILLTADGRVKVTDFGVARLALSTLTQAGTVLGSPSYMSPEQVRGLTVDSRSDVFSAAVVFYEMITRERPFGGTDVATTMYRIAHEPPAPPAQFNSLVSPAITSVIERALQKNADERYQRGADLVADLREAVGRTPLPPSPTLDALLEGLLPQPSGPPSSPGSQSKIPAVSSGRSSGVLTPVVPPAAGAPPRAAAPPPSSESAPPPAAGSDRHAAMSADVTLPAARAISAAPVPSPPPAAAAPPKAESPRPAGAAPAPAAKRAKPAGRSMVGFIVGFVGAAVVLAAVAVGFLYLRGKSQQAVATDAAVSQPDATPPVVVPPAAAGAQQAQPPSPEAQAPAVAAPTTPAPPAAPAAPATAPASTAAKSATASPSAPNPAQAQAKPVRTTPPAAPAAQPGTASAERTPGTPRSAQAPPATTPVPVRQEPPPQAPAAQPVGRTYESTEVDERPVTVRQTEPTYPSEARRKGLEDVVVLKLLVSATGEVADVQVLRKSQKDPEFDSAAVAAVRQWAFKPARRRGENVACWFNVGVPFKIPK
jgi:TonB family protein